MMTNVSYSFFLGYEPFEFTCRTIAAGDIKNLQHPSELSSLNNASLKCYNYLSASG